MYSGVSNQPSVTRNPSIERSPEPPNDPKYYTYPAAAAAERAAKRYSDPIRWPSGRLPSTPVAFLGEGLVWAFGGFSKEELEEMEHDPEAL
jgi:hypothetical protein